MRILVRFFYLVVIFVCMAVCGCAPAPFGLYPKAVLQAYETSERKRKSHGRLLGRLPGAPQPTTNPPNKAEGSSHEALWSFYGGPGRARPSPNR